mgnify:FL=1
MRHEKHVCKFARCHKSQGSLGRLRLLHTYDAAQTDPSPICNKASVRVRCKDCTSSMRDKCTRGVDPSTCACQKLIHALQAAAIEPLFFCGPVVASAAFYIFLYSVWSLVFTATFLFCFERFGPRCHSFGSLLAYVSLIDH